MAIPMPKTRGSECAYCEEPILMVYSATSNARSTNKRYLQLDNETPHKCHERPTRRDDPPDLDRTPLQARAAAMRRWRRRQRPPANPRGFTRDEVTGKLVGHTSGGLVYTTKHSPGRPGHKTPRPDRFSRTDVRGLSGPVRVRKLTPAKPSARAEAPPAARGDAV